MTVFFLQAQLKRQGVDGFRYTGWLYGIPRIGITPVYDTAQTFHKQIRQENRAVLSAPGNTGYASISLLTFESSLISSRISTVGFAVNPGTDVLPK